MEESVLTSVVLPLALFIIMLGVGLSLVVDDFKRVVIYPKAVVVGLVNQLILLPLVAFGLAKLFGLSPLMAVGLMLIACCPGGVTSNLITFVARGDAALSVTLTAISGVITVVTIPLILIFSMDIFLGEAQQFSVPLVDTILQILVITVLPISLGMLVRRFKPAFADKMERPARIGSTTIFVLILGGVIAANTDVIKQHFLALSGVTAAMNIAMMLIGFWSARLLQLKAPQAVAISIETGIQNGTLAIVIATSILNQGELAVVPGVYSLIMFMTGAAVMYYFGVLKNPAEHAEAAVAGGLGE